MPAIETALRQGLGQLGLCLSEAQISHLLAYQTLIQKWNKVYNLTSVRDPAEMLTHHLLDSLAVIEPLRWHLDELPSQEVHLLDVGSGAGLPGVVIAICCPQLRVDCVDTVGKKAAFIQQVAVALKLSNLRGVHARVENLTHHYQVITSRAFASLTDFTHWSATALTEGGTWIAMKGKHPAEELAALPASVNVFHVEQLSVPGLNAQRCLIWLRKPVATIVA
jgi:16S rRNA (guanine527-N7)-methyltransferase